ncbi:transcription factor sox-3-like [Cataglyphis hispanica]|uniref:transcription factor sox-3-like n=1 Tax=Cataglyphis hispanica TaxID=1086592 RepID=UPI00218007A3|nr:transcription factor sox-3-like [Cataglyphis hispanica]
MNQEGMQQNFEQISNPPHCWPCLLNCPSYSSHITNDNAGQQKPHIKRPMNPFMVWSSERRKEIAKENPRMHNSDISKQLGEEWKNLPQETKQLFIDKSNQLREDHKKQYPEYRYRPRKKIQTVMLQPAQESLHQGPSSDYISGHPNPVSLNFISPTFNNNYLPPVLVSSIHPHYASYNPEEQQINYLPSNCPSYQL